MQLELPWALGPPDGRYVVRPGGAAGDVEQIVVLRTLGARERRRLGRRRGRTAEPEPDAAPVTTTRATVILTTEETPDEDAARRWVKRAGEDEVRVAIRALNGAVRAQRLATADPTVREVGSHEAIVIRVGYGRGEQVAEGQWSEAIELPPAAPPGRRAAMRPAERVAALLSGRDAPLVCEDLALRARLDLDHEHVRQATLQLEAALAAALVELDDDDRRDLRERHAELAELRKGVADAAAAARHGELDTEQREIVTKALGRLEAALRARAAAGGDDD